MTVLGSRKARTGPRGTRHLPHLVGVLVVNTGDSSRDVKSSGEIVRGKRLTKARCPEGESEGAEESEHRQAVYPGSRPHGEGPSRAERLEQRYPANAQAVHGACSVDAGEMRRDAWRCHEPPRRTAGVEPCAVKGCAAVRGTESLTQSREVRR